MKGALARSGAGGRRKFEGGQMPLYRRLPKRGFSNAPFRVEYAVVNVEDLNRFELGTEVNAAALHEKGLVSRGCGIRVKILGRGSLKVALKVVADRFSRTAVEKIRQAGGEVRES
jgi:large subunit ribosomal protein L15